MVETKAAKQDTGRERIRDQVLDRIEKLPSLSNVVTEFLALAKREYFTAKDFEKVISKDQALVTRLLKVANSPMYSGNREIRTIPEAVVLIGLDNMKKIVYAVSSEGLMLKELRCYQYYPAKGFWWHSMASGLLCRALAEASPECGLDGEEAFVAGLVHDVGKLILDGFLDPKEGPRDVQKEEEIETCGIDHAELAEHIMKGWGIPENIHEAVRYHHSPRDGGEWRPRACLLNLAGQICDTWGIGTQAFMDLGEEIDPARYSELLEVIGLPEERLSQILWDVRQKLVGLEDIYGEEE